MNIERGMQPLKSASFHIHKSYARLSEPQRAILQLIKDKIKDDEAIAYKDVMDMYIRFKYPSGHVQIQTYKVIDGELHATTQNVLATHDSRLVVKQARQWFLRNLGACVAYGGLLVVPRIYID